MEPRRRYISRVLGRFLCLDKAALLDRLARQPLLDLLVRPVAPAR